MRAIGCFLLGVVAAVLVVAFGLFALENGQVTQFSFLGNTMHANLWLLVGIPAVIGFLLALLAVTPARASGDRSGSVLRGQYRSLERDLADQRRQNEQLRVENGRLRARYDQMVTERNTLDAQLAAAQQEMPVRETAATGETAALHDTTVYNEMPPATRREGQVAPRGYDRVPVQETATTDETAAQREAAVTGEPVQPTPPAQPTLGERLRGVFGGERTSEEEEADRINSRGPAPTM